MRYHSKTALRQDIRTEHDALINCLNQIPNARYGELGVWGDGWTVTDLIAHLAEWHTMFLTWYEDGAECVDDLSRSKHRQPLSLCPQDSGTLAPTRSEPMSIDLAAKEVSAPMMKGIASRWNAEIKQKRRPT